MNVSIAVTEAQYNHWRSDKLLHISIEERLGEESHDHQLAREVEETMQLVFGDDNSNLLRWQWKHINSLKDVTKHNKHQAYTHIYVSLVSLPHLGNVNNNLYKRDNCGPETFSLKSQSRCCLLSIYIQVSVSSLCVFLPSVRNTFVYTPRRIGNIQYHAR